MELGAAVVDADAIARELTGAGGKALPEIRSAFGTRVFRDDDGLDRAALGRLVFGNGESLARLNGILHPLIMDATKKRLTELEANGAVVAVVDAPLLIEAGFTGITDEVWLTYLSKDEQTRRLMARSGLSEAEALVSISSQASFAEKARHADVIIQTMGTIEETREIVKRAWEHLLEVIWSH